MKIIIKILIFMIVPIMIFVGCAKDPTNVDDPDDGKEIDNPVDEDKDKDKKDDKQEQDPVEEIVLRDVNGEECIEILQSSPYKDPIKTTASLGLSDVSKVGVDKDKLENEELYKVVENPDHLYKASDIGLVYGATNNSATLSRFIETLKDVEGTKVIKFEGITYDFPSAISISGVDDLYLVGEEGTLFLNLGWTSYLSAVKCNNLHINNINFDMKYSPTISGTIDSFVHKGNSCDVTISVSEEFDLSQKNYRDWRGGNQCSYMECSLDEVTGRYTPDINKNLMYNSATSIEMSGVTNLVFLENHKIVLTLNKNFAYQTFKDPHIGDHISFAFTMYQNFGFSFTDCEELYLENLNTYVTGGMGLAISAGRNAYLNRVNFRNKEGSDRIMTCTADIFHTTSVEGDLKITNCLLEESHDDALNIKTWYCKIDSVLASKKEITVSQMQSGTPTKFDVGDVIEIFDPSNMGSIARYTVTGVEKAGGSYTLTLDTRPKTNYVGLMVGNDTKATHLYLHNCLIQNKRNRGILLQCRYSEISNCCFRNICHGPIQIFSVRDVFGEAIMPYKVVVKDNKFFENYYSDINVFSYGTKGPSQGVIGNIKDITITNNYIRNSFGSGISVTTCGDSIVSNNLIHLSSKLTNTGITISKSRNIQVTNNALIVDNEDRNVSLLYVEVDCEDVTEEGNLRIK